MQNQGFDGSSVLDALSAMPSKQNALAALLFPASHQLGKWPRRLLGARNVFVYIGSSQRSWHYAMAAAFAHTPR
jgi:hypothetical protein